MHESHKFPAETIEIEFDDFEGYQIRATRIPDEG
jgi:hypothetical protein